MRKKPGPLSKKTNRVIERFLSQVLAFFGVQDMKEMAVRIARGGYNKGINDFENEYLPPINVTPDQDALDFLEQSTFENIKGMRDDTIVKLRQTLSDAVRTGKNPREIAEEVDNVMGVGMVRARAIARTEMNRAYNEGSDHAARQTGYTHKEVVNDNPESAICKSMVKKEPIPIGENYKYQGKEYDKAPFHVNCNSTMVYSRREEE